MSGPKAAGIVRRMVALWASNHGPTPRRYKSIAIWWGLLGAHESTAL